MKSLIAAALMLASSAVCAQHGLVLHGKSFHHEPDPSFNELNWGAGYRYTNGAVSGEIGAFKNTYRRWSPYVGVEWLPLTDGPVSAGIGLLVAGNYPEDKVPTIAGIAVAPFLSVRVNVTKNLSFSLRTIPITAVTELSAGWTFR